MDLISRAREYLESERGRWRAICERTGLDYSWLTKFAQGQIPDPGVSRIEKLLLDKDRDKAA